LNSSVSNGPFDAKLTDIRRHSLLRINGEHLNSISVGRWTEDDIHNRGNALLQIAKHIWPHP
jgi:hypothetical protein